MFFRTDGFNANPSNSVKLTFHVIIPKTFWEWDSYSDVHIRFGHKKLDYWKDCGTFKQIRYIHVYFILLIVIYFHNFTVIYSDFGNGMVEMTCTFDTFDKQLLKHPIPYKYVVNSPKMKHDNDCYEYLHAHAKGQTQYNRCLHIPREQRNFHKGSDSVITLSHLILNKTGSTEVEFND